MNSVHVDKLIPRIDIESAVRSKNQTYSLVKDALHKHGCIVLENLIDSSFIESMKDMINAALEDLGYNYPCDSPKIAEVLKDNKHVQSALYDKLIGMPRKNQLLLAYPRIREVLHNLFHEPILYQKSPLRIDVPFDLSEMTLWHQDYFYVKGSFEVLTLYIPLDNIDYISGALSVCPGSHTDGPVPHRLKWGKKSYPDNTAKLTGVCCELKAGSALVFNALVFHQTNPNYSELVNYNIQYRISEKVFYHNPKMGDIIHVPNSITEFA